MKPVTFALFVIMILLAFLHLLRLIFQVEVVIGTWIAPMWVSVLGLVIPPILARGLWSENGKQGTHS